MRYNKTVVVGAVAVAVAVSAFAAAHRWGDSGHAIGLIKAGGGSVRHPVVLDSGLDRYSVIVTATVIPPYRGDARVVLEGNPELEHEIYLSEAVVDFHLPRRPEFSDHVLHGLRPGDRLALWVTMKPSQRIPARGRYQIAFYDTKTGGSVLDVPVIFKEGTGDAGAQHH